MAGLNLLKKMLADEGLRVERGAQEDNTSIRGHIDGKTVRRRERLAGVEEGQSLQGTL